jgi:hypothetical protein
MAAATPSPNLLADTHAVGLAEAKGIWSSGRFLRHLDRLAAAAALASVGRGCLRPRDEARDD